MAVYADIPNAELDIDEAVKSSTAKKFRDNALAVTQGDPTAKAAGEGVAIEFDFGAGSQTAIITDEIDTDKSLTPDGLGGAKWTSGVSGMVLVERKEIGAAVTSVSFAGLDGDTDEIYKLVGRINHPAGVKTYTVNPNGNGINVSTRQVLDGAAAANVGGLNIMTTTAVAGFVGFEMLIHAREVVQAINILRLAYWKSINVAGAGSPSQIKDAVGTIQAAIANITTLDIVSNIASGIGIGSTFNLYKLSQ